MGRCAVCGTDVGFRANTGRSVDPRWMSAFGGKADVIQGVTECPLIAKSGHRCEKYEDQKYRF